ncbi:hypothetical protein FQR65_LT08994 [Abscondita terminalis]|nr:hypothetical protein FQR65_LT08994 [Abscondita terminalis]
MTIDFSTNFPFLDLNNFKLLQYGGVSNKTSYMVLGKADDNIAFGISDNFLGAAKQAAFKLEEESFNIDYDDDCSKFDYYFANDDEEPKELDLTINRNMYVEEIKRSPGLRKLSKSNEKSIPTDCAENKSLLVCRHGFRSSILLLRMDGWMNRKKIVRDIAGGKSQEFIDSCM